ncbi:MAG: DUF2207 domain-containing protein [Candidatus Kerfeldbacteria bacterium]
MRKLILLAVLALAFVATPSFAANLSFPSFLSDITVNTDASILVRETIVVTYHTDMHGFFRTIPFRYDTGDGGRVSVPISNVSVTQDSSAATFTTSKKGNDLTIKVGDPNKTITGEHEYVISYTASAVVNFFSDHDELYWNVTGDKWDAPLQKVDAIVHHPSGVSGTILQLACYTGEAGSRETNCTSEQQGADAVFNASTFLTIVTGWQPGIVIKPSDYDSIRSTAGTAGVRTPISRTTMLISLIGNAFAAIVIIAWFIRWWLRHGRDPKSRPTVIAQYDPPDKLRPGEVGTIYDEQAQARDVIATIVDLAVRGYLVIEEVEKGTFLGLGDKKDYQLVRKKDADPALKPFEEKLLSSLFDGKDSVTLSSMKGKFAQDLRTVERLMYEQTVRDGYFSANPDSVRKKFFFAGLIVTVFGFFLVLLYIVVLPLAGILAMIMAKAMPQRTAKGVDATWHCRGFREYLERAEKYRLQWQEKEKIFEQFLPYAMVFGVVKQWTEAFKDIAMEQPSWYHGAPGTTFNSLVLWSALNNFTTVATNSFVPPAAKGSSGFGGGGFSGGGFGGGGGGGW